MMNGSKQPEFHEGFSCCAYKEEKFYSFGDNGIVVLKGGDQPASWTKSLAQPGWHSSRMAADRVLGRLDLLAGPSAETITDRFLGHYVQRNGQMLFLDLPGFMKVRCADEHAYSKLTASIPDEIAARLSTISERRWHVYQLLARCPRADELFDSNPALCFALASSWVFRELPVKKPLRAARALVRCKRKRILDTLGFPSTRSAEKILRRIPHETISIKRLLYLRNALGDERLRKRLAHMPVLTSGVLRIVCDPSYEPFVSSGFLLRMSATPEADEQYVRWQLGGIIQNCVEMHMQIHGSPPPAFASPEALFRKHDQLANRLWCQEMKRANVGFPAPPIPGTDQIVPITDWSQLLLESEEQHNCVFRYREKILAGQYAVYRVLSPVRATVGLVRTDSGWILDQLYAAENKSLPKPQHDEIAGSLLVQLSQCVGSGEVLNAPASGRIQARQWRHGCA